MSPAETPSCLQRRNTNFLQKVSICLFVSRYVLREARTAAYPKRISRKEIYIT